MPNIKEQRSKRRALNKKLSRLEIAIKKEREKLTTYFKKRLGKREPWLVDFEMGTIHLTFCKPPAQPSEDGEEFSIEFPDSLLCHPDPVTKESRLLFALMDHFNGDLGKALDFCDGATIWAEINVSSQTKVVLN